MCKYAKFSFVFLLLLAVTAKLTAADNVVLSEQAFSLVGKDGHLVIKFQKPMGYITHSPVDKGKTLLVKLKDLFPAAPPAQTNTPDAQQQPQKINDRLVATNSLRSPVDLISYEQDQTNNGILTIQFNREINYSVDFSRDRKSLTLILKNIQTAEAEGLTRPEGTSTDLPIYTLNLLTSTTPIDASKQAALVNFRDFDIYTDAVKQPGRTLYSLHLGYFYSSSVANANLKRLQPYYPTAWVGEINPEKRKLAEDWFFNARVNQLKKQKVEKKPPGKSEALMGRAKQAMIDKDYPQAIRLLTRIQELGEPAYQQETLELLGLARERNGQVAHAKAEYEEYLRRYPEGEDAERVKQRLFGLVTSRSIVKEKLEGGPKTVEPEWDFFGSLFQFYRRQTVLVQDASDVITDNSLNTDLIYTGRKRGLEYDQRFNVSANNRYDFQSDNDASNNQLYSFYYDITKRDGDYGMRIGRQTHNSDGILGRFDGVIVNKAIGTDQKISVQAGYPVDLYVSDNSNSDRYFYGVSYDVNALITNTDFKFYYISQTNAGLTDRTAVGTEVKYLSDFSSMFFVADYDTFYSKLNIATFVGTWRNEANSTLNFIADYRQNPTLTTNNALIGQPVSNLSELQQLFTDEQIYQLAQDRTSVYKSLSVSASTVLTEQYQLNGDITVSNLGETVASGGVPPQVGTGNDTFYSATLVATNFFTDSDLTIFGLRYSDADTSSTTQLNFSSNFRLDSQWRVSPRLIYQYRESENSSTRSSLQPRLVVNYRATKALRLELDMGYEAASTDSTLTNTTDNEDNYYIYFGYIYDF